MNQIKRVLNIAPQATKIRSSEEELRRELKAKLAHDTEFRRRLRSVFQPLRIFLLGKSTPYVKPDFTATDCFMIVFYLQLNIRFVVNYIDLSLQFGGFLVWVSFSIMNLLICSGLAFMYTFFGDYSSRCFLSVWEMNPLFQGISLCMVVWEMFRLIETGLILSSGLLSIPLFFQLGANDRKFNWEPFNNCTSPDKYVFKPGWAVPIGISKTFTNSGYNQESNAYSNWRYDAVRGRYMGLIWLVAIFIRIFQFKRYRIFPVRIIPIFYYSFLLLLILTAAFLNKSPAATVVYANAYSNVFAYLQIFAFSISDYLPSHWVSIGYLHPNVSSSSLIWQISFLKIACGFVVHYAIPYFAQNFREYAMVTNDNCLHFFGIHFLFIVIPISIWKLSMKYVDGLMYSFYMILTFINAICYLVINLDMLAISIHLKSALMYRFRNLVFIIAAVSVYSASQLLSVNTLHYALFYMNYCSHYYSSGILMMLTMLGIAIYGLERINADHHFLFGTAYKHLNSTKLLVVVCTVLFTMYILDTAIFYMDRERIDWIYWMILGIVLTPFTFGVINTLAHKKSYHGCVHPLTTWGRPQELIRIGRRRKDLRRMFIYRTKRICLHNCLLNHRLLLRDTEREIRIRQRILNEVLDLHLRLVEHTPSEISSII